MKRFKVLFLLSAAIASASCGINMADPSRPGKSARALEDKDPMVRISGLAQNSGSEEATGFSNDLFDGSNDSEVAGLLEASWDTRAPVPVPGGLSQSTSVAANGLIYEIGGGVGAGPDARINQIWAYDPSTNTWSRKANIPLPDGIAAYGAAVEVDGFIYVFGGVTGALSTVAVLNTIWIYDVANDSWSAGPNLPTNMFGPAVAAVTGKIIIAGGSDGFVLLSATYEFDPVSRTL